MIEHMKKPGLKKITPENSDIETCNEAINKLDDALHDNRVMSLIRLSPTENIMKGQLKRFKQRKAQLENEKKSKEMPTLTEPTDWLVGLIYDLLRDSVPSGSLERIVRDFENNHNNGENTVYSNGHLAEYAKHLVSRIRSKIGSNDDHTYKWYPVEKFDLEPGHYMTRGPNSNGESEDDYPVVPEVALYDGVQWQSGFEQLASEIYCLNEKPVRVLFNVNHRKPNS